MTLNRENLLGKIRALMAKTIDRGCSEAEAMAALAKAKAMIDAYEVSDDELKLTKEEKAILHEDRSKDTHGIKNRLAMAVAEFTDCQVWKNREGGLTFCGLPSDAQFASWLTNSLAAFVQCELVNHLAGSLAPKGQRRFLINGFVAGCTLRITQRIRELIAQSAPTPTGRALVVVKSQAIAEAMKAAGIHGLRKGRRSRRQMDASSYAAGKVAGDRASFGRPVGRPVGGGRIGR